MTNTQIATEMLRLAYGDDVVYRAPETMQPPYQILALIAMDTDASRKHAVRLLAEWRERKASA